MKVVSRKRCGFLSRTRLPIPSAFDADGHQVAKRRAYRCIGDAWNGRPHAQRPGARSIGRMIRGTGVARALGRVRASRDDFSSATVYRESVLLAAATFTAKTNRCPSWLMFPRFPPIGPGSLNSSLGVPALNVGVVVTSTDMTSSSLDSRF